MSEFLQSQTEEDYKHYLDRFHRALGEVEVGGFATYRGQLVQKLSLTDFEQQEREYQELYKSFRGSIDRGDTINDVVVRLLRGCAIKLMRKDPVEL